MAIGDIWEFTLRGTYLSQEVLNVFHYRETTAIGNDVAPEDMAAWLWDNLHDDLTGLLSTSLTFNAIDVFQVTGGTGIGTFVITDGQGQAGLDPMPSSVAFGFRYNRASSSSRHGYKRFAGVGEGEVNGNTLVGTYTAQVNALASALEMDLFDSTSTLDGRLEPIILSRVVNGQVRPVPIAFPISSIVFAGISTQNTRKP